MPHSKAHSTLHLPDEAGTLAFGAALAHVLEPGLIIYLHGDLGTGKTTLTRALLHAAGYVGHVKSPTYTLAERYPLTVQQTAITLIHFDLYRMIDPEEFLDAGFREYFDQRHICIIEWPEKAAPLLPAPDIDLFLSISQRINTPHAREVECQARTDQGTRCLNQLHFAPNL